MDSCIFCKIAAGLSPARVVYQDSELMAFHDIRPLAPLHLLIAPRQHIESLNQTRPQDEALLGRLILVARQLAQQEGVAQSGYRLVINTGPDGGQTVFHLHLHLLGGKRIAYPLRDL